MKPEQHLLYDGKYEDHIAKIAQQIRDVFVESSTLSAVHQKYVIRTYLSYLLHKNVIGARSICELQVFIYKLATEIFDQYDCPVSSCATVMISNSNSAEERRNTPQNSGARPTPNDKNKPKLNEGDRRKIVKNIMAPYKGLSASMENQDKIENELQQKIDNHLVSAELAMEYVVEKITGRIIAAMEPKVSVGVKLLHWMNEALTKLPTSQLEKKYLRIKKYHEKGLLKRDCKQMYRREIMKHVPK